ncbi:MAG TPA: hypothetical protein VHB21_00225, partial [Minicystis sp.]|nr:hypothetical protein [Minicystis sp.]
MDDDGPSARRGGLLLRHGDGAGGAKLSFVPASVAVRIAPLGVLRRVPGLRRPAIGVALADGEVVTVLELGP